LLQKLQIIVQGLETNKIYRASIRNITGQEIANLKIEDGIITLDKKLAPGVYLIIITENGKTLRTFKAITNAK